MAEPSKSALARVPSSPQQKLSRAASSQNTSSQSATTISRVPSRLRSTSSQVKASDNASTKSTLRLMEETPEEQEKILPQLRPHQEDTPRNNIMWQFFYSMWDTIIEKEPLPEEEQELELSKSRSSGIFKSASSYRSSKVKNGKGSEAKESGISVKASKTRTTDDIDSKGKIDRDESKAEVESKASKKGNKNQQTDSKKKENSGRNEIETTEGSFTKKTKGQGDDKTTKKDKKNQKVVTENTSREMNKEKKSLKGSPSTRRVKSSKSLTVQIDEMPIEEFKPAGFETISMKFKNGNRYEGAAFNKLMDGTGTFIWSDGTTYEGEFYEGNITGNGTLTMTDLSKYQGQFSKSFFHGVGTFSVCGSSPIYSGDWYQGEKHGNGWILYEGNDWYNGGWEKGLKNGSGIRSYGNGCSFKGDWIQGRKSGVGAAVWENGDFYNGEWLDDNINGFGKYVWNCNFDRAFSFVTQTFYEGSWVYGKRTGQGIMNFGSEGGSYLQGKWAANFKEGDGIISYNDNSRNNKKDISFSFDKPVNFDRKNVTIFTTAEIINVDVYIEKVAEKFRIELTDKFKNTEETAVRYIIIMYLSLLRQLYAIYAMMAVEKDYNNRFVMIRLFLWEFYRDTKITAKGITLVDIDESLFATLNETLKTKHEPFEMIYFWQFLHSLLCVLFLVDELVEDPTNGILAVSLRQFIDKYLQFNPTKRENSFCANLDVAPLQGLYALYKNIGEPVTAKEFLKSFCLRYDQERLCDFLGEKVEIPFVQGSNVVYNSSEMAYLKEHPLNAPEKQLEPSERLGVFSKLSANDIVANIAKICPISSDGLIININYSMTFLEFFEVLLLCTKQQQELIKLCVELETVRLKSENKKEQKETENAE